MNQNLQCQKKRKYKTNLDWFIQSQFIHSFSQAFFLLSFYLYSPGESVYPPGTHATSSVTSPVSLGYLYNIENAR